MNQRVLITGANRGIGLALVREFLDRNDSVIAACRNPEQAAELGSIRPSRPERLAIIQLDVLSDAFVMAAAREAVEQYEGLDVLINNAGIFGPEDAGLSRLKSADMLAIFDTNAVGPVRVAAVFLGLLRRGRNPRIVNISSESGMISRRIDDPKHYAYGASKAALNFLTRAMAAELLPEGIIAVALSPGWVRTDTGGPEATLSPEDSARGIVKVIHALTPRESGRWLRYDGAENEMW